MIRYAAVLLSLLAAGCATVAPVPPVSEPPVVAPQAATPQPVTAPVAPTKTSPAKPVAPVTPPTPPAVPRGAAPRAPATPPVAAATPPAAPLDLKALEAQLRATKAIGLFTKISLKNQVDDLMKQFRDHYGGKTTRTITELRSSYDLLIMKVLSLLQDDDRQLASAIVSSREAIWGLLSDQNKFANL